MKSAGELIENNNNIDMGRNLLDLRLSATTVLHPEGLYLPFAIYRRGQFCKCIYWKKDD